MCNEPFRNFAEFTGKKNPVASRVRTILLQELFQIMFQQGSITTFQMSTWQSTFDLPIIPLSNFWLAGWKWQSYLVDHFSYSWFQQATHSQAICKWLCDTSSHFKTFKTYFVLSNLVVSTFQLSLILNARVSMKGRLLRSGHQSCSVKKMFLEISQNSQENTCARDSFLKKLQDYCNFIKKEALAYFEEHLSYRTPPGDCFWLPHLRYFTGNKRNIYSTPAQALFSKFC